MDRSSTNCVAVGAAFTEPTWRHSTTAAIGGVTDLGAEATAAVPVRSAVLGGGGSSPDSSRLTAAAIAVLTGVTFPLVAAWNSAPAGVRHRALRTWRGLPDGMPELFV